MKLATRILSLLVMVGLATFYVGCGGGGGDDETQEEKQLKKLKSSWALESASDGTPRTSEFPNLVLTLEGNYVKNGTYAYSFTGTRPNPSPWPVSGTWKFGTDVPTQILRDPGSANEFLMTYSVTDTKLTLKFTIPDGHAGFVGGTSREKKVSGEWTFVFNKQ